MGELTQIAKKIAEGTTLVSIFNYGRNEMGDLGRSFQKVVETLEIKEKAVVCLANGNLGITISPSGPNDTLGKSLQKLQSNLNGLVDTLRTLTSSALNGHLSARGEASKFQGGYRDIVQGVNDTLDAVIAPVQDARPRTTGGQRHDRPGDRRLQGRPRQSQRGRQRRRGNVGPVAPTGGRGR
ncbi:MAG: HAMP domain-containing protein [Elusimicrobia bacterium]|nr:HAMP domain-containing protein [Elusimicrobiota bacterium]